MNVVAFREIQIQIEESLADCFRPLVAKHLYPMMVDVDQGAIALANDRHWIRAATECSSESVFSFSVFLNSCR